MSAPRPPHPATTGATRTLRGKNAPVHRPGTGRPSAAPSGERRLRDGRAVPAKSAARRRPRRTRRTLRLPLASGPARLHVVLVVVAMAISLCAGRLLQLQGFDSASYSANATDLLTRTLPLLPARGEITDRNGNVLASTLPAVAVTADPSLTTLHAFDIADVLSPYLQMSEVELLPLLTEPGTRFVYLKKKVPALTYTALAADLAKRGFYGVFRENDPIRTYPNSSVAAAVVGFVGADGHGLAGLEYSLNSSLAGTEGKETYESAPNGSKIPLGASSVTPASNGDNYQLTLDSELQWMVERRLAASVHKTRSDSGIAIVEDITTGQILAMANYPTYDSAKPNAGGKRNLVNLSNRAVADPYEPGSVEKVLTAAALFDSGRENPESKLKIPNSLRSGGVTIHDHFDHPGILKLNVRGAVARSSNIGMAIATRQLSKQQLRDYLVRFGLGAKTGIEVPGESTGILPRVDMSDGQRDQVAFGQAISVTAIQEIAAIGGLVNGGLYHPPTLIKQRTDGNGQPLPSSAPPPRRIISERSSAEVRDVMQAVVDQGANTIRLKSYQTGGKTGTAQRADPIRHRYNGYVTSFVGFAPLNKPKLMTYVVLNHPRKGDTGSGTAGPVYKDIMNFALPRYSVPPNTKHAKVKPIAW